MRAQNLFAATLAVALLHGLVPTPIFAIVVAWAPLWWPFVFAPTQSILIYAAALMISTLTLLLAGVPAAIYERLTDKTEPSETAAWIWLAGTVVLTVLGIATRG
jgi:hypothetical protein